MKHSFSRGGENPVLLQEKENVSEDTNDDADVNTEANKINDNIKDIVVKFTEEKKTLEYQETMNVDIENISSLEEKKLEINI